MSRQLDMFAEGLEQNAGDWDSIRALFLDHVSCSFLEAFVTEEICTSAEKAGYIVPSGTGQGSLTFINTPNFEYSVRVVTPFARRAHQVKWLGMPQMIAIKGGGTVVFRTLRVPPQFDIEQFVPNVQIRQCEPYEAHNGDVVVSDDQNEILDLHEVTAPAIIEFLTYRRLAPSLVWTFSPELISLYAEQSSLTASRLRNVLSLAQAAGIQIPDDIYDLALKSNSPQVVLPAIQSMLAGGHAESFPALQRAMESERQSLRKGANELFDALFSGR
jgi:hypothetical protein